MRFLLFPINITVKPQLLPKIFDVYSENYMQEHALNYKLDAPCPPQQRNCNPLSVAYFTGRPPKSSSNGIV